MADTKLPSTAKPAHGKALAFAAASLMLGACLQTDPDPSGKDDTVSIPQDNDRRAGASSSTNWPTDAGTKIIRVTWDAGTDLRLYFDTVELLSSIVRPTDVRGAARFYPAGTIPALESPSAKELRFEATDTLVIPGSYLDSLWKTNGDSLSFNLEISTDSVQGWFQKFVFSRSLGKVVSSPLPYKSGEPAFLRPPLFYFTGNLKVDTAVITPVSGKSDFCFYIPGTPIFGKVQADSLFKIGPLPRGEYPLRLLRLSQSSDKPGETLVEAWEAPVDENIFDSSMTPGAKVLSVRTQGTLNLRNAE